ncbi:hypothetical protein HMPREF9080_01679, partial [Cardiobacterium valvarum F0432]
MLARQAAQMLAFRRFATLSPASGGRDYFVPSSVNAGPSSGINTGSSKRRKCWFLIPLPSLRDTFPRKRRKGLFCAKRRK